MPIIIWALVWVFNNEPPVHPWNHYFIWLILAVGLSMSPYPNFKK